MIDATVDIPDPVPPDPVPPDPNPTYPHAAHASPIYYAVSVGDDETGHIDPSCTARMGKFKIICMWQKPGVVMSLCTERIQIRWAIFCVLASVVSLVGFFAAAVIERTSKLTGHHSPGHRSPSFFSQMRKMTRTNPLRHPCI
jgi:hypothetical protein